MLSGVLAPLGSTAVQVSRFSLAGTPFGDMYEAVPGDQAVATVKPALGPVPSLRPQAALPS